ncbi:MAG: hypothetical protein ACHQII_05995 [Bacteroidia bacterium]
MCFIDGKNILILFLSFSEETKNADELVLKDLLLNEFKNKGFTKLFCAFNEIENPIKAQTAIVVYVTTILMK